MDALNKQSKSSGFPEVHLKIGIHTGCAALGNYGSATRLRYSVIGDAVNIAARLCGSAPQLGSSIVVSGVTYNLLRNKVGISELGDLPVKDASERLKIYAVRGTGEHAI
jgi:adenylate cyclase